MAMTMNVLDRFVQVVDALEYSSLRIDPSFALVMTFEDARDLYYQMIQTPDLHYLVMGNPGEFSQRTMHFPGTVIPPPMPSRERNVWGTILGVTIVIKGTEDAADEG